MPRPEPLVDLQSIDLERILFGPDEIRRWVPQRHEFELLHGILYYDPDAVVAVAYHEVSPGAFWVRGHIPGRPLFPGVLMIESAAQLCCYLFCRIQQEERFFAFAGVDAVRFRGTVQPGDRLVLVARGRKMRGTLATMDTQAYVDGRIVYEGVITGMVLPGP